MTFERLIRPDLVLRMDFLSMSGFNACTWVNRPEYQGGQLV